MCHFAQSLARRLQISEKSIGVYYVDPGTAYTEITNNMPWVLQMGLGTVGKLVLKSAFQGACCSIYAALSKELEGKTGLFLFEGKIFKGIARSSTVYHDERESLWTLSEELVSMAYPFALTK